MTRSRRRGRFGVVRTLNYLAFAPLASRAPTYGRLLFALLRDERVPASRKAVLGLVVAYLASPIDLIPEYLPLVGALDDVAVVVLGLDIFLEGIAPEILEEKLYDLRIDRRELERDLVRVRRIVPKPVQRLILRLPDAIEGAVQAVRRSGVDQKVRAWIEDEGVPAARVVAARAQQVAVSTARQAQTAAASRPPRVRQETAA